MLHVGKMILTRCCKRALLEYSPLDCIDKFSTTQALSKLSMFQRAIAKPFVSVSALLARLGTTSAAHVHRNCISALNLGTLQFTRPKSAHEHNVCSSVHFKDCTNWIFKMTRPSSILQRMHCFVASVQERGLRETHRRIEPWVQQQYHGLSSWGTTLGACNWHPIL